MVLFCPLSCSNCSLNTCKLRPKLKQINNEANLCKGPYSLDQSLKSGRIVKYRVVPYWAGAALHLHSVAVNVSLQVTVCVVHVVARPVDGGPGVVTAGVSVVVIISHVVLCLHELGVGAVVTGVGINVQGIRTTHHFYELSNLKLYKHKNDEKNLTEINPNIKIK